MGSGSSVVAGSRLLGLLQPPQLFVMGFTMCRRKRMATSTGKGKASFLTKGSQVFLSHSGRVGRFAVKSSSSQTMTRCLAAPSWASKGLKQNHPDILDTHFYEEIPGDCSSSECVASRPYCKLTRQIQALDGAACAPFIRSNLASSAACKACGHCEEP